MKTSDSLSAAWTTTLREAIAIACVDATPDGKGTGTHPGITLNTSTSAALPELSIEISADSALAQPLVITWQHRTCTALRLRIHAKGRSKTCVVLHAISNQVPEAHTLVDLTLDDAASVQLVTVAEGSAPYRYERHARVNAHATLKSVDVAWNATAMRDTVELCNPHATADTTLLHIGHHDSRLSCQSTIVHQVAHCTSKTHYRAIAASQARTAFCGRIVVAPGAQKTDAAQASKVLLLSDTAQATTEPQLEILADDVKCSHGSSIGQLDDAAIFYLRSRGLDLATANQLLTYGFASAATAAIENPSVRTAIDATLQDILRQELVP